MNKPPPGRDFYIGAVLVILQGFLGFWRFPPASGSPFNIAVIASVAISIGFIKRAAWARGAAILVAIFGVIGEFFNLSNPAVRMLAIMNISLCIFVIYWLGRKSVKEQFKPWPLPEKPDAGS